MSTNNTYFSLAGPKASAVSEGTAFLVQDASVVDGTSTNAIFRFAHTGQIKNTFNDLMLRCEDRAAYAIDVRGASGNIVFAENVFNNIEVLAPTVHAVRIGDHLTSGFDVDGACNSFKQLRMRLKTGQGGVYLDALNIFNVTFFSRSSAAGEIPSPTPISPSKTVPASICTTSSPATMPRGDTRSSSRMGMSASLAGTPKGRRC